MYSKGNSELYGWQQRNKTQEMGTKQLKFEHTTKGTWMCQKGMPLR